MNAPQEIVCLLLEGGLPKTRHATALRVHGAQDVADRPVFASRVQPLQTDEDGAAPVGVEKRLESAELLAVPFEFFGCVLAALVVVRETGVHFLQPDLVTWAHPEPIELKYFTTSLLRALPAERQMPASDP